jgi:acyl-CoA thioesterase II
VAEIGFFASLLTVEPRSEWEFAARLHDYEGATLGSDALGRLVLAAGHTVQDKSLHAFHASFLRPVPAGIPLAIRVEPLMDGRRLARRRAALDCHGRLHCEATASFAVPTRDGVNWQDVAMPPVPPPETLPKDVAVAEAEGWTWDLEHEEFEWGFLGERGRMSREGGAASDSHWSVWLRPRLPLPAIERVHEAALVFASDYVSHWSASRRLGRTFGPGGFASLDHQVHVHRLPIWDDWWLFHSWSDVAHAGRALLHRRIFARDGALIASVAQEGLIADRDRGAEPERLG